MKKLTCSLDSNCPHDFIPESYLTKDTKGYLIHTYLPVIVEKSVEGFFIGLDGTEFTIYTNSIAVDEFDIIDFNEIHVFVKRIEIL